ncbi:MAG: hypothetical protein JW918_07720 [Anaerolineae bacterium]|nr:hypothetical protein [Anaerolineae bacterium]
MHSKLLVVSIALIVAAQACCCCTILGGSQPPYTITPSDEAVTRLEERIKSTEPDADGTFSVTVTEEEMTSLMVQWLDEMEEPPPISQPQVHFRNGRIEFYMIIHFSDAFESPGMIAFTVDAQDDKVVFAVEEMAVGPIPLPQSFSEVMTDLLNESFEEVFSGEDAGAVVTDVRIGDKEMTVFGQATRE